MRDRARLILETAIHDFIDTGHPITSERLFSCGDFGIKPAMIRWELNTLADAGYFFQTHPSGGRFPTNKAYRFLVSEILSREGEGGSRESETLAESFFSQDMGHFINGVADHLSVLGVGYETRGERVYESGLSSLLERLEVEAKEDILAVIEDVERLGERLESSRGWWGDEGEWPQVFIGQSPVTRNTHLAVVASKLDSDHGPVLCFAIGPKRMDYQRTLKVFRGLQESCSGKRSTRRK